MPVPPDTDNEPRCEVVPVDQTCEVLLRLHSADDKPFDAHVALISQDLGYCRAMLHKSNCRFRVGVPLFNVLFLRTD